MFFEGFALTHVDVPAGRLRLRHGGSGPPLLLLHGDPETHAMWHAVAPPLARRFTVICPDLRGHGGSFRPAPSPDRAAYAKTEMARDMVELMTALGHDRFQLAGHDRGAQVAHRMALDFPQRIERVAVLDIVPMLEQLERADMTFAFSHYDGFWFGQTHPKPESLVTTAPDSWFRTPDGQPDTNFFHPEALADYLTNGRSPEAIASLCEDYRAALAIDLERDRLSRAEGKRVQCPLLALWGAKGQIGGWYDPLALWRVYCDGPVTGGPVQAGHYLAEEAPGEVVDWFERFFV
ncbi:MAG TPA: alpha/beta hydrolase [Acetobacteraceae bacterium]|nr:alpha/beta hydrolase [Acetobacteraceae bacterium]